jgi:hypothetical protein
MQSHGNASDAYDNDDTPRAGAADDRSPFNSEAI